MPFLNRFVGNPILTGMLNVLFGVKVSDAHCGMRAVRREALPVLDLHSTGMEFASEMVFKAYRRGLTVSEVPIDYYPRVGESKLNRFGDAWRHVRFMLLYSPSWLYLVPGSAAPAARARRHGLPRRRADRHLRSHVADPHDARLRRDDAHRRAGRSSSASSRERTRACGSASAIRCSSGSDDSLTLEHGLVAPAARSCCSRSSGLVAVGVEWARERLRRRSGARTRRRCS